jgi:hypothetical protein
MLPAQTTINKAEIRSLINEWNRAHANRSDAAFKNVYADSVVFDLLFRTAAVCIYRKQDFLRQFPDYRQKIASEISYTQFPGVVKCEFTKEVIKDSVLWRYPAYVLVVGNDAGYRIAGESDDDTGRTLGLYLNRKRKAVSEDDDGDLSDEPSVSSIPKSALDSAGAIHDTGSLATSEAPDNVEYVAAAKDSTSTIGNRAVASDETVAIPVQFIYLFAGVLIGGSLLLLLIGSAKAKSNRMPASKVVPKNKIKHDHSDREQSVVFEKFVIMLFDPLYFKAFRIKEKKVLANGQVETEEYPELEFEFNHKDNQVTFVVESMYIPQLHHQDIQIATREKVRAYRQLDEDDNDLYLVLGIEGRADDPKEIYLIPVRDITHPFITYPQLQRYRKYGMFFYNADSGRLQ